MTCQLKHDNCRLCLPLSKPDMHLSEKDPLLRGLAGQAYEKKHPPKSSPLAFCICTTISVLAAGDGSTVYEQPDQMRSS